MNEIKCPNCNKVFTVDESGYAQLLKQVRDASFEKEIARREEEIEKNKENDLKVLRLEQEKEFDDQLQAKDMKIAELESKLENTGTENKLAMAEALKDQAEQIADLKHQLEMAEANRKIAVNSAVEEKDKTIIALNAKLENKDTELALQEKTLKEKYEGQLKDKQELIDYYKDLKTKMSTKMVGETLEQHCLNEFNSIRMTAFPNAEFDKDNDARTGSKGDFIYREKSEEGIDILSIMFEMKNEMDTTTTKHKNEDFFKELDKDRREKGCEYAVLVSLLEADSDYYNNGIVDVSYKYEKMYVIRPQFFIPMITLLRNAALNSLKYKKELEIVKGQQIDLYNFERDLDEFKNNFTRSFALAGERFADAIKGIDKTIEQLTKIRENLVKSENHLNAANNKIEAVSIKKLTKNAPSVRDELLRIKSEAAAAGTAEAGMPAAADLPEDTAGGTPDTADHTEQS